MNYQKLKSSDRVNGKTVRMKVINRKKALII